MSTGSDQYPLLGIIDQLSPSKDVESVAFSDLERERDTIFLELEQLFESKDAVCVTKEQEPEETKLGASGDLTEISSEYPMADASSYCPPTHLLDYSSELPPAIYWMGSQRISVGEADRAYLVQIRPDISHDVVVALVEQVLMTNCGVVKIVEAANGISGGGKTTFEVHSCLECASLRCYIGVTRDRQRGVLLHMVPSTRKFLQPLQLRPLSTSQAAAATFPGSNAGSFARLADSLESILGSALHCESMTLGHLGDHGQICATAPTALLPGNVYPKSTMSGIHPSYVLSLQEAMAAEMYDFVEKQFALVDAATSQCERKCARLMTLLRPVYEKAGLELPVPTNSESTVVTEPGNIMCNATLENASLLILRARKKTVSTQRQPDCAINESPCFRRALVDEMAALMGLIEVWCEGEAQSKLLYKEQAAAVKKNTIDSFRVDLVKTLLGAKNLHSETLMQLARIRDNVVFEGACVFEGKRGTLYLTEHHMTFHFPGILLLASSSTHVFPISSIAALGIADNRVSSSGLHDTTDKNSNVGTVSHVGVETVRIVMSGESSRAMSFTLPGPTPDHARRVADLIGCLRSLHSQHQHQHQPSTHADQARLTNSISTTNPLSTPPIAQDIHVTSSTVGKVDKIAQKLATLRFKS